MYYTTGLNTDEIIDICTRIACATIPEESKKWPPSLGLFNSVAATFCYMRHNDPQAKIGEERQFESCTGAVFTGKALREGPPVGPRKSVIVEVGGIAHVTGEAKFRFDDDDPLREGFALSA